MNTFGNIFRLTTFGESHGPAIGGIIDGVPSGIEIDLKKIQVDLDRRRPGQSDIVTGRKEEDKVEILSGFFEGRTIGTPIGFVIPNADHHSSDYEELRDKFRPGHADFTYAAKYGHRDHRGGGRASARETACRVVGGAVAKQILETLGIKVYGYSSAIGSVSLPNDYPVLLDMPEKVECNQVRCPDSATAERMERLIREAKAEGDTLGGIVTGVIEGLPAGLGEPVYGKLQAALAGAMMSINAAKGFDYGMGFGGARQTGSQTIDPFVVNAQDKVATSANNSGGIQGGITNGMPVYFRVAFKPVATLLKEIDTIDRHHRATTLKMRGRHDPCVVPRAVPVVEAMAAMTVLDFYLLQRARRLEI